MFNSAGTLFGYVMSDAKHIYKKLLESVVAEDYIFCSFPAFTCQSYGLVRRIVNELFFGKGTQCLGYGGAADIKTGCDVFAAGFLFFSDYVVNSLNVVFEAGTELGVFAHLVLFLTDWRMKW